MRVTSVCRPIAVLLACCLAAPAHEFVGPDGPPAWRAALAGATGRQTTPPTIQKNITQTPGADERDASWSASGNLIAFASNRNGDFDIFISRTDGSHPDSGAALTPKLISGLPGDERFPAWSPGGTELAYVRGSNIFIRNLQTGIESQVNTDAGQTIDVGQPTGLVFSFGGTRLAFSSRIGTDTAPNIYWISLDPNNRVLVKITDTTSSDVAPAWFPQNNSLLFASNRNGDFDIFQVDQIPGPGAPPVPEGQHRQVIGDPGNQTEPAWVNAGGIPDPQFNQPFHLLYADDQDSGGLHFDIKVADGLGPGELVPTPSNVTVFADGGPNAGIQTDPFANPVQQPSNNLCVFSGNQTGAFDLFTIEVFDGSPPILAGIDPEDGNFKPLVPTVTPKQTFANSQVTIRAPLFDAGSGVAEAYALIHLADEPVFQRTSVVAGHTDAGVIGGGGSGGFVTAGTTNIEFDHMFLDGPASAGGAIVRRNPTQVAANRAGLIAFARNNGIPLADADGDGVWEATWITPSEGHDFYVDIVAFDGRGNVPVDTNLGVNNRPGGGDNPLARLQQGFAVPFYALGYDRVTGFTTKQLDLTRKVLVVSDYAGGQKFQVADFAGAEQTTLARFWPAAIPIEHYYFNSDDNLLHSPTDMPQFYLGGGSPPTVHLLANQYLPGIWPFNPGAPTPPDFSGNPAMLESALNLFGGPVAQDLPAIWRVLCRGPVDSSTYNAYAPVGLTQTAGNPLPAQDGDRMIVWLSPYSGDLFVGPGTLLDADVQSALTVFAASGGRLFVTGQDIAWALTKNGTQSSGFLRDTLRATFVSDAPPDVADDVTPDGAQRRVMTPGPGVTGIESQVFMTTQNPITNDLYTDFYRWFNPQGEFGPPDEDVNIIRINGLGDRVGFAGTGAPNQWFIDDVQATNGGIVALNYASGGATAMIRHIDATTGGRMVFACYGFEAQRNNYRFISNYTPNTNWVICHGDRPELMSNISEYLRTGGLLGKVVGPDGSTPAQGITVEARLGPNPNGPVMATTTTLADGTYLLRGLSVANYSVYVVSNEFTADHRPYQPVFGAQVSQDSDLTIRLLRFETGTIFGTVTETGGATVSGAAITATLQTTGNNPFVATTATDNNGIYSLDVPAGTYTVTAEAQGFGAASQTNVAVIAGDLFQVDLVLQPAPGTIQGKVSGDNGRSVSGARVALLQNGVILVTTQTNASGDYSLDVAPGTYLVQVSAAGFETAEQANVAVVSEQITGGIDFTLTAVPPGSLVGLITIQGDPDPVGGAEVRLLLAGTVVRTTISAATTTTADGDTYNFRFDDVPAGTYDVEVDASGFSAATRSGVVVVSDAVTTGIDFVLQPLHIFVQGLSMVSAPFGYQAVAPDIQTILDDDNNRNTRLPMAAYNTGQGAYVFYPERPADTLRLGTGYFMKLRQNVPLTIEGTRAPTTGSGFDIPLGAGWNLIGHVYEFPVDLFACEVVFGGQVFTIQDAAARGMINAALFTLNFNEYQQVFRLDPYTAYWIRAFQAVSLRVPPEALRSVSEDRAVRQQPQPGDWAAEVIATSAGGLTARGSFGVRGGSADLYDPADRAQPPRPPLDGYLELSFPHDNWGRYSGRYREDMRSQGRQQTWDLEVSSDRAEETIELTWPALGASMPGSLRVVLEDLETGRQRSLRHLSSYRYTTGRAGTSRRFRITVEPLDGGLQIAAANYSPSRAGGGSLTFTLTAAAAVEVTVQGVGGTTVRQLAQQRQYAGGTHTIAWDGRDREGRPVPGGTYRIVLVGVNEIGEQVRAVRLIQHRR